MKKDKELSKKNQLILGKLMRLLGVRSYSSLARNLGFDIANFSRISTGERTISDRILWRAAILTDKRPRELLKELDISEDCFFEYYHKDMKYEQKAA